MGEALSFMLPERTAEAGINPNLLHMPREGHKTAPNDRPVRFEKPWHRHAAHMLAAGVPASEVAEACECSTQTIRNLIRTPWFQEVMNELIDRNGGRDVQALFKAEQFNSFTTLCEIRDDPKVSPAVRANVAIRFIEQVSGKPTQRVEVESTAKSSDPVAEVERIERENLQLAKRLNGTS
jgi:hypothetical protein